MPYLSKDQVKLKRAQLKKALPGYKLSVRKDRGGIEISIMEGPVSLTDRHDGYDQINHYHIEDMYSHNPEAVRVFKLIEEIASNGKTELVYDGDYGSVPTFYTWINVGKWDKPYQVVTMK